jgi:hypothetical protein
MPKPTWFGEAEGMQERRGAARHSVYLGAQFRGLGKSAAPVTLLDLSMLGCRIEQSYSLQEGSYGDGEIALGATRSSIEQRFRFPT